MARRATGTAVRLSVARPVQVEVLPAPRSAVPRLSGRGCSAAHRARPYPGLPARRKLRRPGRRWLAFPDNRSPLTTDAAFKRTALGGRDQTQVDAAGFRAGLVGQILAFRQISVGGRDAQDQVCGGVRIDPEQVEGTKSYGRDAARWCRLQGLGPLAVADVRIDPAAGMAVNVVVMLVPAASADDLREGEVDVDRFVIVVEEDQVVR